jgi:hypothetical protein
VQAIPTAANKVVTTDNSGNLEATYTLIDPYTGTTTVAQLDAADWSSGTVTLPGFTGEERLTGTNYIYKCISDNTWIRSLNLNLVVSDYILGTVSDSGGKKTSAQMIALYPSALPGNIVYGSAGKYEYMNSVAGWAYYANTI